MYCANRLGSERSVNCYENVLKSNSKIITWILVWLIHGPGLKETLFIVVSVYSGFFRGSVLRQDTSEPLPCTVETQERHE